jgi:hypothetical protein
LRVVQDDRRVGEQHSDEEVPHHPAGRREPEDAVAGLRVDVQVQLLEVLEQDPAVAVDDRLRQAGRAARVQDPQRVVERDAGPGRAARLGQKLVPSSRRRPSSRPEVGTSTRCSTEGMSRLRAASVSGDRSPCRR